MCYGVMCSQVYAWLAEMAKRPGSVVWKGCLCIYVMCVYVVGWMFPVSAGS